MDAAKKALTIEEIEQQNGDVGNRLWVIIEGKVYDLTTFDHPGGREVFQESFGIDRIEEFIGHSAEAIQQMKKYEIGFVIGGSADTM